MKPAVLLLGALALSAQDAVKTATVEGLVVNSVTGAGIEGATVRLGARNSENHETRSDANGSFRFTGVKPGEYIPDAYKAGFFLPISGPFGRPIHIGEGPPPLRLELLPPARLRGRVIDGEGKPAAKVEVALGPQYAATATTNEDGVFVFENVEPRLYSLMARVNHVRTYYPAAIDPTSAEPIPVRPGADQGGYEIRLQTATTHRVRGVVLDAAGKPAPKTVVEILPRAGGYAAGGLLSLSAGTIAFAIASRAAGVQPEREDPAVTNADGVFEFPSVVEGDWVFRVESEDLVHGAAAVGVRQDIDNLKIRLDSPFELPASVTLSDGSPAPEDLTVVVRLVSLEGLPGVGDQSGKDGTLRFRNVAPGRYRIQATIPSGGYYVSSVMSGTNDVTHQPTWLNAASPPVRIILKPGATITGTVEKGESGTVLLVPQTLAPGDIGFLHLCGATGTFDLVGIAPGNYYAIALKNIDFRNMQAVSEIERLRVIVRDAAEVRLEEGAVTSVQLSAPVGLE